MNKKMIPKIIFIDTNIFINCALAETKDLNRVADINTLKDIKEKLDNKEMVLVLPENIRAEIITEMKIGFKKLKKYINDSFSKVNSYEKENKGKISMLIKEEIEKSKKDLIAKIIKKSKKISKTVNEIIEHKNVKIMKLSDKITLLGIKRSSLMKRSYTPTGSENKNSKSAYLRDQDCIAFEAFLDYLNKNKEKLKKTECIICSDDSDYFEDFKKNVIHADIIQEIKCKNLSGYRDVLDMLKKEFGNEYSKEQINEYRSDIGAAQNLGSLYGGLCNTTEDEYHCPFCKKNITIELKNDFPHLGKKSAYASSEFAFETIAPIASAFVSGTITSRTSETRAQCPYCKKYFNLENI